MTWWYEDGLTILDYSKEKGWHYRPVKESKMNEWNYTSEKLPEKQEMGVSDRVVVAIKGYNIVDVGYYDFDLQAWFVMDNRYPVPVYAWQSIKPPREA